MFSVKSFYEKLLVGEEEVFLCSAMWIPKVLRMVCIFTDLATREVILMAENLRKWKVDCVNWCYMC